MGKVVDFSKHLWRRPVWSVPARRRWSRRDSANLIQALTLVTETRATFQKFSRETQMATIRATFAAMAEALRRYAEDLRHTMTQEGDDNPPHCA